MKGDRPRLCPTDFALSNENRAHRTNRQILNATTSAVGPAVASDRNPKLQLLVSGAPWRMPQDWSSRPLAGWLNVTQACARRRRGPHGMLPALPSHCLSQTGAKAPLGSRRAAQLRNPTKTDAHRNRANENLLAPVEECSQFAKAEEFSFSRRPLENRVARSTPLSAQNPEMLDDISALLNVCE